jgi:hypothetical protein
MKYYLILLCIFFWNSSVEGFDAVRDVRILLSTRRNVAIPMELRFGDIESVRNSTFDRWKPTVILIHGFLEGENAISGLDTDTAR